MKTFRLMFSMFGAALAALVVAQAQTPAAPQAVPPSYDFGDSGSAGLTAQAWRAHLAGDLAAVEAYTGRAIQLYKQTALTQQAALTEPVPTSNPAAVHAQWALNDVGTCYFILGQALEKAGKAAEAILAYREVAEKLAFARCWDDKGWFWSPADAARGRVKALEFEAAM